MPTVRQPTEFSSYPTHRMFGIVDDDDGADSVVAKLNAMGLGHDLWVLTGESAREAFDADGDNNGLWANIVRTVQKLGYEAGQLKQYEEAALAGAWVIAPLLAEDPSRKDKVADVFAAHNGRQIRYLGTLGIEDLHRNPGAL